MSAVPRGMGERSPEIFRWNEVVCGPLIFVNLKHFTVPLDMFIT